MLKKIPQKKYQKKMFEKNPIFRGCFQKKIPTKKYQNPYCTYKKN